jgi:hypothetical protein
MRLFFMVSVFALFGGAAVAAGGFAASWAIARDGRPAGLILQSHSPVAAGLACLAGVAVCALFGVVSMRLINRLAGLFIVGLGLYSYAARTGNALNTPRAPAWALLAESAAWTAALFVLAKLVFRDRKVTRGLRTDTSMIGFFGVVVIAAALGVGCAIARDEMKGQALIAASLAALLGAFLWRIAGGRSDTPVLSAIPLMSGLVAAIGNLMSRQIEGAEAHHSGPSWLLIMPQDWAAGALVGGVLGILWAESLLVERTHSPTPNGDLARQGSPPTLAADATTDSTR